MLKRNYCSHPEVRDHGGEPFIFNIEHAANMNENFRVVLWTGRDMQLTLMSIPVCGDIGVEMHCDVDQFIRVVSGRARVYMGNYRNDLQEMSCVDGHDAILIPAGTWHNIVAWESKGVKDLDKIEKGVTVHVTGRLRLNKYTSAEGTEKQYYEVLANNLDIIESK